MITTIVVGALSLLLAVFVWRLSYTIIFNLINGRKYHHALSQEFDKLRLSNMLSALGISQKDYIYQTSVKDIHHQMKSCSACKNTDECDEKLTSADLDVSEIGFCNNETDLKEIKQQQSTS